VAARRIDFVLFDLGGVLIDPGGVGQMREWSGVGSDEEVWARWLACRWVRRFESGQCSAEEFAAGVVDDWGLAVEPAAFLQAFGEWPRGPYGGATELVTELRDTVRVGCLSNTNALQWESHYEATPLADAFELRFLSFELGMVKPDRNIFDLVGDRLPVPPGRVLFLDDNAANVDAAVSAGFLAEQVRGIGQARDALVAEGLLTGSGSGGGLGSGFDRG
jgi:HAD superfamily hydrolase (TIGR01509 family)